ncbi:MAG TPA: tetratricopeptide repeat protein [Phenylobacterium sp.]
MASSQVEPTVEADADPIALTERAEVFLRDGQLIQSIKAAAQAADLDPGQERTWLVLGRACEAANDFPAAFSAYGQALSIGDGVTGFGAEMGRVALRVGEHAIAESVLSLYVQDVAPDTEVIANLARAQMAQGAYDRAQATLTSGLEADAGRTRLWISLGELLCLQGRYGQSTVFFEEALRLEPGSAPARAGLAEAVLHAEGDDERALQLSAEAVADAAGEDIAPIVAGHARRLLATGRLAEGWAALARGAEPGAASLVASKVAAPRWIPGEPLHGRLLLMGEPDLARELLVAHVVPGLIAEGLPLILAVAPEWMSLARRSFPEAAIAPRLGRTWLGETQQAAELDTPLLHDGKFVAAWAPMRSMPSLGRGRIEDFAGRAPYLRPEGRRVRHWREWLASLGRGPKVGITWRQPGLDVTQPWEVPSLGDLQPALATPGLRLVSLQDGEVADEAAIVGQSYGVTLHQPPGLVRGDLDDMAALARALDVVVGPPGVKTYLAAGCGAPTWFLATRWHWARLGTDDLPWFPKATVISADGSDWTAAMAELAQALAALPASSAGRG